MATCIQFPKQFCLGNKVSIVAWQHLKLIMPLQANGILFYL